MLLAISDVLKPLQLEGTDTGFVFLGQRLSSDASAIAGPIAALFLAAYAAAVWTLRRWAVPLAWLYAVYVTTNVVLFPFRTPQPADAGVGYFVFGLVYTVLAIGGAVTYATILGRRRSELR